jgi:hypothetical protein
VAKLASDRCWTPALRSIHIGIVFAIGLAAHECPCPAVAFDTPETLRATGHAPRAPTPRRVVAAQKAPRSRNKASVSATIHRGEVRTHLSELPVPKRVSVYYMNFPAVTISATTPADLRRCASIRMTISSKSTLRGLYYLASDVDKRIKFNRMEARLLVEADDPKFTFVVDCEGTVRWRRREYRVSPRALVAIHELMVDLSQDTDLARARRTGVPD